MADSAKSLMAVKFAEGSDDIIEGLAIPFGGPFAGKDLHGEAFDAETDFSLDWFPTGRPLIFEHGLDNTMKAAVTGRQIEQEVLDVGVWARAQLDKSNRYFEAIKDLVNKGKLFFSSGSVPHLVETTEDGKIKRWPWVELSLTPQPANLYAAVHAVKATTAMAHISASPASWDAVPEPVKTALSAIADWERTTEPTDASEPETLADHSQRVLAEVKAWVERVSEKADFRAKSGRELSKANVATLREAHRIIGDLLERNDREAQSEEDAHKAFADWQRLEAELAGVTG